MLRQYSGEGVSGFENTNPNVVHLRNHFKKIVKPLASAEEVEREFEVVGFELFGKLEIPSNEFKLGLLSEIYSQAYYMFRSSKKTNGLAKSRPRFQAFRDEPQLPPGTLEVINDSDLGTLIRHEQIAPSALGLIIEPGNVVTLGRDGHSGYHLGNLASRRHVQIAVDPNFITVTDLSQQGTTLTYNAQR